MKSAVYAGTFDPVTNGHLSVIERAAQLFDRVYVVVAINSAKTPLFDTDERLELIRRATAEWTNVEAASTSGYVVDFARAKHATVLVRGLRGATDADYETELANANRALAPEITTIFLPAHPELSEVSSTKLKAMAAAGEDVSTYCPPGVESALRSRTQKDQAHHVVVRNTV